MATNGNPGGLTTRQKRAIVALLAERDVKAAAQACGIGYRTLCRWLDDSAFRAELTGAEGEAIDAATRRLLQLQDPAIDTISATMDDQANPAAVRLRAAQIALETLLKLRELRNLEQRLAELEAAVYGNK